MSYEDKYFTVIRSYMNDEARNALDTQIPAIKKEVSTQIDEFAKNLATSVQAKIKTIGDQHVAEMKAVEKEMEAVIKKLEANGIDDQSLERLKASVATYQENINKAGAAVQKVALTAARSAGLPVDVMS